VRLARLSRLPRADWGRGLAHAGFGVTLFAAAAMNAWKVEDIRVAQAGERFPLGGYEVALDKVTEVQGPNYTSTMAEMTVFRGDREVARLFPEKRFYPVQGMPTTEAAIDYGFWRDIYLVIGDPQENGGWAVRSYIEPFANWLWGGALLMAIGGLISLSDRRYRVAAGARRMAMAPAE
jgi:cytochrome c-type biogenesis protein CcmF